MLLVPRYAQYFQPLDSYKLLLLLVKQLLLDLENVMQMSIIYCPLHCPKKHTILKV